MSFQAGVAYFDAREIPAAEAARIRALVQAGGSEPTHVHQEPGLVLAFAASAFQDGPRAGPAGVMSFDGRLDNAQELLARLGDSSPVARDPAALALAACEKWGSEGLGRLVGDWSLAWWDRRERTVVLASDYAGVRPLYYCADRGRVAWSTLLQPLVDWARAEELDDVYLAGFLAFGGCPNRTPYRGIGPVPPGCAVRVTAAGEQIRRFWSLPAADTLRYRDESEYADHLRQVFREGVACRLPAGSRCLSELSGGMDSSTIVATAADLVRSGEARPARFATLTVEHAGSRDTRFYTAMESHCGFEAIHLQAADYPWVTEQETGGPLPAFWESLSRRTAAVARQMEATTYLTGRLGDEVMGQWWDDCEQVTALFRTGRIGAGLRDSFRWSHALQVPLGLVLWRSLRASLPPALGAAAAHRLSGAVEAPRDREDSIAPDLLRRTGMADPRRLFSREWMHAPPERRRICRSLAESFELRRLQPPEFLQHLDYTHPYLHRPLVEFLLSIPAEQVCGPGEPRRLMRKTFHSLWPPALRKRRSKDQFGEIFLDALRPLAREMLQGGRPLLLVEGRYVERRSLLRRLERMLLSMPCNEAQLRQIILLEFWLRARQQVSSETLAACVLSPR